VRILIIGGTRFIGPQVVQALVRDSHEVIVLHRGSTTADLPSVVSVIKADRRALTSMGPELGRLELDAVLDMICMTDQDARELALVCREHAPRVVVLSSMDVYQNYGAFLRLEQSGAPKGPLTEHSPLRTILHPYRAQASDGNDLFYNYDKILVEQRLMGEPGLSTTVLRLPAVYGPGDHRCFDYLKRMIDGRRVILMGSTASSWCWTRGYVENVADAIALAVTDSRSAGRIYNIGEVDGLTEAEWARAIGRAAGWEGEVVVVPEEVLPSHLKLPYDFKNHLEGDTQSFRRELGYSERISREEAISRTVDWERENPPAQFDPTRFDYQAEDAAIASAGLIRH
jgi:nucleoside-diphosphate-sugar epimerase